MELFKHRVKTKFIYVSVPTFPIVVTRRKQGQKCKKVREKSDLFFQAVEWELEWSLEVLLT